MSMKDKIAKLEDDLRYYKTKSSKNEQAYVNYMNENRKLEEKVKKLELENKNLKEQDEYYKGVVKSINHANDVIIHYKRKIRDIKAIIDLEG
jgi:predicted RNase H-like nuclease (RuvC/YqgF family)